MTIPEFIGFVVTMVALAVMSYRRSREEKQRREHPELYEEEERQEQQNLKELLRSLDVPEEEIPPELTQDRPLHHPKPRPVVHQGHKAPTPSRTMGGFRFQSNLDRKRTISGVETRQLENPIQGREKVQFAKSVVSADMEGDYALIRRQKTSRLQKILKGLGSPQEMIILHEVLMPPKALRKDDFVL